MKLIEVWIDLNPVNLNNPLFFKKISPLNKIYERYLKNNIWKER